METPIGRHQTMKFRTVAKMPIRLLRCLRSIRHIEAATRPEIGHSPGTHRTHKTRQTLPDRLIFRVLEYARPLDLCTWRRVSKAFKGYVDERISNVIEIDVRKTCIEKVTATSVSPTVTAHSEEKDWQRFRKANVKIRLVRGASDGLGDRVELVVDERWRSADVIAVCRSMGTFRKSIVRATIDAPIAEMLVVSLSVIDLSRWYAYLCILKAFEGVNLHMNATNRVRTDDIYWPSLAYLTIRTSQKDSEHLARVLDYGVRSNFVIDRRRIEELRVQFTDVDKWNQDLSKNLYQFRCWAGSAGFGDRFSHQFAEPPHA